MVKWAQWKILWFGRRVSADCNKIGGNTSCFLISIDQVFKVSKNKYQKIKPEPFSRI